MGFYTPLQVRKQPVLLCGAVDPVSAVHKLNIFSRGNDKEYLAHVAAVVHLIHQKGLNVQCRKLTKTLDKLAGTLENLQKPNGPKGASSKEDQKACKLELSQTQEMLKEARKAHNKAVAKMFDFPRSLLSSDRQSQWDRICRKMHKCDLWVGVNGQMTTGSCLNLWVAF